MAGRRNRSRHWRECLATAASPGERMSVAWDYLRARIAKVAQDAGEDAADTVRESVATQLVEAADWAWERAWEAAR